MAKQVYPETIGNAVKVNDPTTETQANDTSLNEVLKKISEKNDSWLDL